MSTDRNPRLNPEGVTGPPAPAAGSTHTPAGAGRALAFRAGRLFHRARAAVSDLTFSPDREEARHRVRAVIPELAATFGAVSDVDEPENDVEAWLQGYLDELAGPDHAEWLFDEQKELDDLPVGFRAEFDLPRHRARLLGFMRLNFDTFRQHLHRGLERTHTDAFKLGELIEAAAFPLSQPNDEEAHSPSLPPFQGPRQWSVTTQTLGDEPRLVLAPEPASCYDRPWPSWWPERVRVQWARCELPEHLVAGVALGECPGEPDERRHAVEQLASDAEQHLGQCRPRPVALRDRLVVCDAGAQAFRLDGRYVRVEDPRAFRVLRFLLEDAPGHQGTKQQLKKLPGCNTDISKVLKKLPVLLRKIVHAGPGKSSFYYLRLPPLPEHLPTSLAGVCDTQGG